MSFGTDELQAIADGYDAAANPAPLVIGHPKMDDPAYGWVSGLSVEDGMLVAQPDRVEPSFAEIVREGRYAKVSAQFYPPDHPHNPKPGVHYLKHVGFLGAHAPGVKGLGTVSLADGDAGPLLTIDLSPNTQEKPMSDPEKKELSFAEQRAELDAREAAVKKREDAAAKAARDARHADHVSFAETLVEGAKLAPAGKQLLIGVLDELGERSDVLSFGEGEADKMTPVAALKKLLGGAKPLVSLGEIATPDKKTGNGLASFAAPAGYTVDPEQAALHSRARELQDANPNLSWMDAVRRAQAA